MEKLKCAIIGCGRISHKHVDAIVNNYKNILLKGVCDVIEERANERAEEYVDKLSKKIISEGENTKNINKPEIFKDYKEMIAKLDLDFVAVTTESGYHPEIAIYCLNNDLNVIVEKPMALSIKDADMMIKKAEEKNKLLAVSFQNRFNEPIQKARNALEKGRFGKMLYGVASIRWNRGMQYYNQAKWRGTWELDGGALMNQCTHNIDLLQWFLGGEAVEVYGVTNRYLRDIKAEDFGSAIVKFKNGAIGIIEGTVDIYPKNLEETLFLSGSKGTVKIGGLAVNQIEAWRFEDSKIVGDTEEKVLGEGYNLEDRDFQAVYGYGHTYLYKDFYESVIKGKQPYITGKEGKKALEIILAIYKSQKTGIPEKLPLEDFSTLEMKGIFDK